MDPICDIWCNSKRIHYAWTMLKEWIFKMMLVSSKWINRFLAPNFNNLSQYIFNSATFRWGPRNHDLWLDVQDNSTMKPTILVAESKVFKVFQATVKKVAIRRKPSTANSTCFLFKKFVRLIYWIQKLVLLFCFIAVPFVRKCRFQKRQEWTIWCDSVAFHLSQWKCLNLEQ